MADVYSTIAALGLSAVSHFLLEKSVIIKIIGGLTHKGVKSEIPTKIAFHISHKLGRLILEVFFLTLTNPITILSFIGIFAIFEGLFVM